MVKSPTAALAEFAADLSFDDLPQEMVYETKRLILDTVGCAIGGYSTEMGKIVVELKRELGGTPESTLLVVGDKTPCTSAAYVNTELANALDADETLLNSGHHGLCAVLPGLAVAERMGASGKELILAVALGFEVAARIGLSLQFVVVNPQGEIEFSPVAGLGWVVFASAVASGKLLGLNGEGMAHALGIAGYTASVPVVGKWGQQQSPRPMTKYVFYAPMAEAGVSAALLAQRGFKGDTTVLDGDRGFWRMAGSKGCDWGLLTGELGQRWYLPETSYKPFPACRYANSPLNLFTRLVKEHQLRPEEIERVEVKAHSVAVRQHLDELVVPSNEVDAQFSIPYLLAVAALGGRPGPDWQAPDKWHDLRVMDFARRVHVDIEPSAAGVIEGQLRKEGRFKRVPASLEIVARGQTFSAREEYTKGDPWTEQSRMSDEEMKEKFRNFCYRLLRPSHIEKAIEIMYSLERLESVRGLTPYLVG